MEMILVQKKDHTSVVIKS